MKSSQKYSKGHNSANIWWTVTSKQYALLHIILVCVEVLRPSQPNGVMSSAISLSNHTFTGQA